MKLLRQKVISCALAIGALLSVASGDEPPGNPGAHWAFQPIRNPAAPQVRDRSWVRSPLDAFVLARLEHEGVAPSPEAPSATLLRRVFLDLTGLPPGPAEIEAFENDRRPDAYERLVDRLLASPHYGERWTRHWLDAARYADSDGYEKDRARPHAWRWRDWVLQALNADLSFDAFSVEQLAGDLLPAASLEQRIATGFHRNTLVNTEGGVDREEDRVKRTVDRTNTLGEVWLGMTIECGQCHDHKYDPLSQSEYYGLYAFFNSLDEPDIPAPDKDTPVQVVAERAEQRRTQVHIRGDFLNKGDEVAPHAPATLPGIRARGQAPDRLDLARWLFEAEHPLTARVAVNRLWQQHFGRGLVATDNDFGTQGEAPSHPELLDWLATRFRQNDWSLKALHRLIVTSATYRQSSAARPELAERDPLNTWLARQNRLRVEAEVIRDLALGASGLLVRHLGGPSVHPPQPAGISDLGFQGRVEWPTSSGADAYRRGLYTFFQRTVPYPMLALFDAPDSNTSCTRRERSNTPLQALTLWNDPVFFEMAQALGRRIVVEAPPGIEERLRYAFRLCLARDPVAAEAETLQAFHGRQLAQLQQDESTAAAVLGGESPADGTAAEQAAWILVGRAILNTDEFITRE